MAELTNETSAKTIAHGWMVGGGVAIIAGSLITNFIG